MLKPSEAAIVAGVALSDVNRAIDRKLLPEDFVRPGRQRLVSAPACILVSFYFGSATQLTSDERLRTIARVLPRLRQQTDAALWSSVEDDWTLRDAFLSIDLKPFLRSTHERLLRLRAAQELVASDLGILGGTPVVKGTRIPVYDLAASVRLGHPLERIQAAYPGLSREQIDLAAVYAKANPPQGRPRAAPLPGRAVPRSEPQRKRQQMAG